MTDTLPKGRVITVSATVILPETATRDQVTEWIEDTIFQQGGIDSDNPLYRHGADAEKIAWDDTGRWRRTTVTDVEAIARGHRYRSRHQDVSDTRSPSEIDAWASPAAVLRAALLLTNTGDTQK